VFIGAVYIIAPISQFVISVFRHWNECVQEALLWVDEVGFKEKEKVPGLLHDHYLRRHSMRRRGQCAALVVGHYCHDRLTLHGGRVVESLGGSVSYITNVFQALGMECQVIILLCTCSVT
jgi:hypothetical protein